MTAQEIVLDTSVALGWSLADEPWHERCLAIARDIAADRLVAVASPTFGFEVRFGLVRAARRGRLEWTAVLPRVNEIEQLVVARPTIRLGDRDLIGLCRDLNLSWTDAHHVLLARKLGRPLVTGDRRLVDAVAGSDIWVEYLGDRPLN